MLFIEVLLNDLAGEKIEDDDLKLTRPTSHRGASHKCWEFCGSSFCHRMKLRPNRVASQRGKQEAAIKKFQEEIKNKEEIIKKTGRNQKNVMKKFNKKSGKNPKNSAEDFLLLNNRVASQQGTKRPQFKQEKSFCRVSNNQKVSIFNQNIARIANAVTITLYSRVTM